MGLLCDEFINNLYDVKNDFSESDENISNSVSIQVYDGVSSVYYEISFIRIHESINMVGCASGGGYEFIEWISGIDSLGKNCIVNHGGLEQLIEENFKRLQLEFIGIK